MTVTSIEKDLDALTMTVNAEFDAAVERTWQLWSDPRQLERWWGPPTHPATVVDHDLAPGALVTYFMTGPDGAQHHGWWRVVAVAAPHALEVEDGFADETGRPKDDLPNTKMTVRLTPRDGGGTRVQIVSRFSSRDAMKQLISMGMDEGLTAAMSQMDAILAG